MVVPLLNEPGTSAPTQLQTPGVLVTGVSGNHFAEMRGLVYTAQRHLPTGWPIVIYELVGDLKDSARRAATAWCGVEVRRFELERFNITLDPRLLTVSMWKPFMIRQCLLSLPASGIVVYADASTRFHEPLGAALLDAVTRTGFIGRRTAGPVALYTHPRMAAELLQLGAGRSGDIRDYLDAPMVCGCFSLWSSAALRRVVEPWLACASRRECILPPGADGLDNRVKGMSKLCKRGLEGHCHRNDQSALSIILHDAFRERSTTTSGSSVPHTSSHLRLRAGWDDPAYLQNTSMGKETWRSGTAKLHGTTISTERVNTHLPAPMLQASDHCLRASAQALLAAANAHSGGDITAWTPCTWTNRCCQQRPRMASCAG